MVLVGLLSGLGSLLKLTGTDIDSPICKLHHNLTTTILLCFCLLVTATNLIGDPVKCTFSDHPLMKDDVVNTYCWIHSTYTLPGQSKSTSAHPGVGPGTSRDEKVYHAYYQWVPFVLFLQAILFYAPYWIWKTWEGGKVEAASMDLKNPVLNKNDRNEKIEILADYLYATLHRHNLYALKYLFCEILNFIITFSNIILMNKFLDGKFISYGTEVFSFMDMDSNERTDPMIQRFPRMTKCTFKAFGSSGTLQRLDSLCVMPHNAFNEKVYLFLWVWFWFLVVVSALAVLWRCVVFFVPFIRINLLAKYSQGLNKKQLKKLSTHLEMGDYFLLYLLHKNVSDFTFGELVREVANRIPGQPSNSLEMGENNVVTMNKPCYSYVGPYSSAL